MQSNISLFIYSKLFLLSKILSSFLRLVPSLPLPLFLQLFFCSFIFLCSFFSSFLFLFPFDNKSLFIRYSYFFILYLNVIDF
jgi:hypothetical protein